MNAVTAEIKSMTIGMISCPWQRQSSGPGILPNTFKTIWSRIRNISLQGTLYL